MTAAPAPIGIEAGTIEQICRGCPPLRIALRAHAEARAAGQIPADWEFELDSGMREIWLGQIAALTWRRIDVPGDAAPAAWILLAWVDPRIRYTRAST